MDISSEHIRLPFDVPYAAQVASEELAGEFFGNHRPLESDPRWAETGAASAGEYAYWANRSCGMACVKMCVEALGGPVRPLLEWVRDGLAVGGYHTRRGDGGRLEEVGWLHSCLAELIRPYARSSRPAAVDLPSLPGMLRAGNLLIASVSYEIGTRKPITRRNGHLVVLTGALLKLGKLTALHLNNPSGREPELRRQAEIPVERFAEAYSGRAIVIKPGVQRLPVG